MTSGGELTCRELVELVTMYFEMTLPPPEKARFEAHLAGCPGCVNYVDQMRRIVRLTGALREDGIATEAKSRLLDAFRDWKRGA